MSLMSTFFLLLLRSVSLIECKFNEVTLKFTFFRCYLAFHFENCHQRRVICFLDRLRLVLQTNLFRSFKWVEVVMDTVTEDHMDTVMEDHMHMVSTTLMTCL